MLRTAATAILGVAILAAGASAQNYSLNPLYGTVNLSGGFAPDPYVINVQSGGTINAAQTLGGACVGYIADAPDVRLNFSAGSLPLIISVNSSADTTLVINAPDGRWYCDDDGGNGLNPSIRWGSPMSGQYDIWIGTWGSASNASAQLHISELYSQ
ncbi:MAG: peptidase S1 [Oceanicaulis sp.]|uniref:peptidase S1 n=1 Tax=Glycocaulis sp. TaxID=1969725 RepID=UPI0025BC7AAE|nr:peptidase S1 [Glycocaulis sp.]MCC5980855.1 peptidase S1 [Oceanicaulis sp.]MCH8521073.1 peptidase S1 [Glycocaulis sp.]